MTDLLPFAENILSHTGTASLDGGESNFNYTGRYINWQKTGKTIQVPNNTNVVLNWKRHKNAYHFKWYTVSSYIGCGEGIFLPSAFPGPLSNYSLPWLQTWLGNLLWKFEFRVSMNMSRPNFVIYVYK